MFNVAIDGPAGAGKSTIAKLVAKREGFIYVDTGAMYRALAVLCVRSGVNIKEETEVVKVCEPAQVTIRYEDEEQQVILNGENVNPYLRTEETGNAASVISAYAGVREKLLMLQRQLGKEHNVVMDGRDIGTNVLKDAQLKVYLTAGSDTRARRRFDELTAKGILCNLEEIKKDIEERDYQDMHRSIAPLKQAEDAIYLDSSAMTIEEVAEKIQTLMREKGWK